LAIGKPAVGEADERDPDPDVDVDADVGLCWKSPNCDLSGAGEGVGPFPVISSSLATWAWETLSNPFHREASIFRGWKKCCADITTTFQIDRQTKNARSSKYPRPEQP
jgi:hypothetical protein